MYMDQWNAVWIENKSCPAERAPIFRRSFTVERAEKAELRISGVGFYVAEINGQRITEDILTPAFTAYDKTVLFNRYDVAKWLRAGENTITVTLGNGWFAQNEPDSWEFEHATWRARPQMICELWADGACILESDCDWECTDSRYTYNSLRCGETYNASVELTGWHPATVAHGPGGMLKEQTCPPIRLEEEIAPVAIVDSDSPVLYDFGVNLSGNVEIAVRGKRGTTVRIVYSELLHTGNNTVDRESISGHVHTPRFQEDQYVLSGDGVETWHSDFGYSGFRYAQIQTDAEVISVKARSFHTVLPSVGSFTIDHPVLQQVQTALLRSTRTNFHHIPTDCPHREKNGWTGDSVLSCEQALFNFELKDAYLKWLDDIVDGQRPNGAIACIVPTSVWGYNWGTGTTWDFILFEIPYQIYRATGDADVLRRYFAPMKKYLGFMRTTADHGIWRNGLGDWCPPARATTCSTDALLTAYAMRCVEVYGRCAELLGESDEAAWASEWAARIRRDFKAEFNGKEPDSQTFLALQLAFDLTDDRADTLARLEADLEAHQFHTTSGIFGIKLIYNALTDAGRFDLAWKAVTVEGYPGWADMLTRCSGTLGETWFGGPSRNHHMFSSVGDWFYKGIAGIHLDDAQPGFRHIFLRPHIPDGCRAFEARHTSPYGEWVVAWDGEVLTVTVPKGTSATVDFGDYHADWDSGIHQITVS